MSTRRRFSQAAVAAVLAAAVMLTGGCEWEKKREQNALTRAALSVEHVVAASFGVTGTPEGTTCSGLITLDVVTAEEASKVFTEIMRAFMNVPGMGFEICILNPWPATDIPVELRHVYVNPRIVPLSEDEGTMVLVSRLEERLKRAVYAIDDIFELYLAVPHVVNSEAKCEIRFVTDVSSREEVTRILDEVRDSIGDFASLKGSLDCSVSASSDHKKFPTVVEHIVINEGLEPVRIDDSNPRVLQP